MHDEDDIRKAQPRLAPEAITIEAVRQGAVGPEDIAIRRETLAAQARQAEAEGYPQLARNFRRAAELTQVPNDVLMQTYDRLRPYRATYYELIALAQELAARYDAPETGDYIRQAAEAYRAKGLLAVRDGDGE